MTQKTIKFHRHLFAPLQSSNNNIEQTLWNLYNLVYGIMRMNIIISLENPIPVFHKTFPNKELMHYYFSGPWGSHRYPIIIYYIIIFEMDDQTVFKYVFIEKNSFFLFFYLIFILSTQNFSSFIDGRYLWIR